MSIFFHPVDEPTVTLFEMANKRALLFVALTETAAQAYGVNSPVIEKKDDAYWIHPAAFCEVVDKVFDHPINLLTVWAKYAAGMYEVFVGERRKWQWAGGQFEEGLLNELKTIEPYRYAYAPRVIDQGVD